MNKIIGFYKKVFEQELSKSQAIHLFSSKIIRKIFISDKEELINAEHPLIPISEKKAENYIKDIELNNQLTFKYYSLARISRFTSFNKYEVTRVYPIISYNAKLTEKEGNYYIEIDHLSREFIKSNIDTKTKSFIDFNHLEKLPFTDFHYVSQLASFLNNDPNVEADELRLFPKLWSAQKISAKIKSKSIEKDIFIPCSCFCLIEKDKFSYSTLDELKLLEKSHSFSDALKVIFDRKKNVSNEKLGIVCEELNFWQQQAIENSNSKILSVISGPPGTGKSYTIANIAAEKVSKGKSVLISSKNNEALDVIEDKLHNQLNLTNLTINPSKTKNLSHIKSYLQFILGRSYEMKNISLDRLEKDKKIIKAKHIEKVNLEASLENSFELEKIILKEINTNKFTKNASDNFKLRVINSRGIKTIPLWEHLNSYYNRVNENRKYAINALNRVGTSHLEKNIKYAREDIRNYHSFLKARSQHRKNEFYQKLNYKVLTNTFPIWLIKSSEIPKTMPRQMEMFDYLIIDEASQCDTPSILPLLQRAKKCIVVGDQNQLSHISFLSKSVEIKLRNNIPSYDKHLCQHRDYSFFSLANDNLDPQDISYLSEHFRSKHAIIEFSNQEIYENQLDILTKRPKSDNDVVVIKPVKGVNINSVNKLEAKSIVNHVKILIEKEQELPTHLKTSIGILSPFRNQVDHLQNELKKELNLDQIKDHKIIIGTAFSFQGNEKDMMLISFVIDDNSHIGSYNYVNRKDVFNVSMTRAKNKQIIYHSFNPNKLKPGSTLNNFFDFYKKYRIQPHNHELKNSFCSEIEEHIKKFGYNTWQVFEISGVKIDVLAEKNGKFIAIDLVGFPGEIGDFYELERYKMLERGGIKLFPLPYAYWLFDKAFCLNAIEELIKLN